MEERIRFIEHKGKKVLLEDFSNIPTESELLDLTYQAAKVVQSQPPKSLLILVDMTNAHYGPKLSQESKKVTAENTPFVKASALVGITKLMEVIVRTIYVVSGRKLFAFATREEALDWLVSQ